MQQPALCKKLDGSFFAKNFLNSFDYVLTDCDGVLWRGNNPIPGAAQVLKSFRDKGKKILFVTNNSSKSREAYLEKFHQLGFDASVEEIVSSSYSCARYLHSLRFNKKVYALGNRGLADELDRFGIRYLPVGPDPVLDESILYRDDIQLDPEVGAVVVALDVHVSYLKLIKAAGYLENPDVLYVATCTDEKFPTQGGNLLPGTGVIVSAVSMLASRQPQIVGKPEKLMFQCIREENPELVPSRSLMIGDRPETDILFGRNNGMQTLLVLTGVTDSAKMEKDPIQADYFLDTLDDMNSFFNNS